MLVGTGCVVVIQLLSRNERANQTLREQASLLDKAQDAIVVTDLQRRLTYWNKSAERLYGWTADEVLGKVVTDLFYPDGDVTEVQQAYDDVAGERRVDRRTAAAHQGRPPGRDRKPLDAGSRQRRARRSSILSINTDVTDRRQLEQQFYRAQRLESIGTLAGGIAHDLNNVLAPIMLGMAMLRDRAAATTTARRSSRRSRRSAQRGADMVVAGAVVCARPGRQARRDSAGRSDRRRRPHCPRHAAEEHRDRDRRSGPGLPAILGDPTQCHQVLLNLCVNARDAMPNGGTLKLSAETEQIPVAREAIPGELAGRHLSS